eukprot:3386452-Prymnesium_polylepis.1
MSSRVNDQCGRRRRARARSPRAERPVCAVGRGQGWLEHRRGGRGGVLTAVRLRFCFWLLAPPTS